MKSRNKTTLKELGKRVVLTAKLCGAMGIEYSDQVRVERGWTPGERRRAVARHRGGAPAAPPAVGAVDDSAPPQTPAAVTNVLGTLNKTTAPQQRLRDLPLNALKRRYARLFARAAFRCDDCDSSEHRCDACLETRFLERHKCCDVCGTAIDKLDEFYRIERLVEQWRRRWCGTCKRVRHRDRNATLAFLVIALCLKVYGKRPDVFCADKERLAQQPLRRRSTTS